MNERMQGFFSVRRYAGEADLPNLIPLIESAWLPDRQSAANIHVGDLFWRLREPEYESRLFVWEHDGMVAGFAEWNAEEATLDLQVHSRFAGGELVATMLRWAQNQADSPIAVFASDDNQKFISLLASEGYVRQQGGANHHCRLLKDTPFETPRLPDGYTVRSLRGTEEIGARVQGHRDGWQSTNLTEELYTRLMKSPGYRTDFDLVVTAPGDEFVATANVWLGANGVGLFEPVSTAPAHRRKGLARSLLLYGMNQLRRAGAQTVWVRSVFHNPAATALYESAGLAVIRRDTAYMRSTPNKPG